MAPAGSPRGGTGCRTKSSAVSGATRCTRVRRIVWRGGRSAARVAPSAPPVSTRVSTAPRMSAGTTRCSTGSARSRTRTPRTRSARPPRTTDPKVYEARRHNNARSDEGAGIVACEGSAPLPGQVLDPPAERLGGGGAPARVPQNPAPTLISSPFWCHHEGVGYDGNRAARRAFRSQPSRRGG